MENIFGLLRDIRFPIIFFRLLCLISNSVNRMLVKCLVFSLWFITVRGVDSQQFSNRHIFLYESGDEVIASNCTCGSCTDPESICDLHSVCVNVTKDNLIVGIEAAETAVTATWIYIPSVTICCNSLASQTARAVFIQLLDFAHIDNLALHNCGNLVSAGLVQDITIYNLHTLSITNENKTVTLDMNVTDLTVPDSYQTYFLKNVAFLSTNILNLSSHLKAFSVIVDNSPQTLTDIFKRAFERSPFRNVPQVSAEVNQFMITPVYV